MSSTHLLLYWLNDNRKKPIAKFAQRWHCPGNPLHMCHFSGSSRASRWHKMTIQRMSPSHLPVISAGILQIMRQMQ
jgi:hypothetical protein